MDIVTGHVGSAHVTSWQDRDLNQGIFGPDTYILNVGSKLAATIISNNEIRIADGTIVMQGCQGCIQKGTYDTISIDNGTQGMQRRDLIVAQYNRNGSTGVEEMSLVVIKGTPAASNPSDPTYTSGDIQNGDTLVQVPIYRVVINGLTLTSVILLIDEIKNVSDASAEIDEVASAVIGLGDYYQVFQENISITQNNFNNIASVTVPAGIYVVCAYVDFTSTTAGYMREIRISPLGGNAPYFANALMNVVNNNTQSISICMVCPYTSTTTINLEARHQYNVGTITGCKAVLRAVRIK